MAANEAWRGPDADAHLAKAEALEHAAETLAGVEGILDVVEAPVIRNAVALLERARDRHEHDAKLGRAA
jgi:hypothetical protein